MPVSQKGDDIPEASSAEDFSQESAVKAKRRQDAHRALELLEEYHSRLVREEDQQLRLAIEQVIRIFKTCLFKALLDIQSFYEITLQNDDKSLQEKTCETLEVASRWEQCFTSRKSSQLNVSACAILSQETSLTQSPLCIGTRSDSAIHFKTLSQISSLTKSADDGFETVQSPPTKTLRSSCSFGSPPCLQSSPLNPEVQCQLDSSEKKIKVSGRTPDKSISKVNLIKREDQATDQGIDDDLWKFDDVLLERGEMGLGFSISGGTDFSYFAGDTSIYVTKIMDDKIVIVNGQLRLNDQIVSVNGKLVANIPHHEAADLLRKAGNRVHLVVKRKSASRELFIHLDLKKGPNGLGFSISGGQGSQYIPGDNGIFVRDIISGGSADVDGRLQNGDRLLEVNGFSLECVTHEMAVAAIKATGDVVRLLVAKKSFDCVVSPSSSVAKQHQQMSSPSAPAAEALPATSCTDESEARMSATPQHPNEAVQKSPSLASCQSTKSPAQTIATDPSSSRLPRQVLLKKGASGLGFNIVGGEEGTGIFISYIFEGGVADLSRDLRRGDQILSVNGVNLNLATHEDAANLLKMSSSIIDLTVIYKPEEYNQFESRIQEMSEQLMLKLGNIKMTQKKTLFVRALFDYDPTKDSDLPGRGLVFRYGDILHVTNASDEEWWQAYRLIPRSDNLFGIIPSKSRVERKERTRLRNVTFCSTGADAKGKSSTFPRDLKKTLFSRKLSFSKSKEKNDLQQVSVSSDTMIDETIPPSYEEVIQHKLKYSRPLIILGPLKDQINDGLITEFPDRFGICIPHTTRPMRSGEVDGRDYHFVSSRQQMQLDIDNNQFIEAGQYSGNLYGTHIQSVLAVANQGRHCVLDVSAKAVVSLRAAELYPIAILIKALEPQVIMEWNKHLSEDEAQKQVEQSLKLEQEFGEYFTAIICGRCAEEIYDTVKDVIFDQSGSTVWLPADKCDSF